MDFCDLFRDASARECRQSWSAALPDHDPQISRPRTPCFVQLQALGHRAHRTVKDENFAELNDPKTACLTD